MGFPGIHWPEPTGARTKKLKTSDRLRPKAPKIKQSIDPWDFRYCKIYIFDQKCVDLMNLQPKKVPIIPFNISINHVIRQRIRRCTLTIKEIFYSHFWSNFWNFYENYPQKLPGMAKLENMLTNIFSKLKMEYSKSNFHLKCQISKKRFGVPLNPT